MKGRAMSISRFGPVFLVVFLGGCTVFAPRYDAVLDEKSTAAYQSIAGIAASIELGEFVAAESYADAAPRYRDAISGLSVASLRAEILPVREGTPAERARRLLSEMVTECDQAVKRTAEAHRQRGIPANAGAGQSLLLVCDPAYRAVQAMR